MTKYKVGSTDPSLYDLGDIADFITNYAKQYQQYSPDQEQPEQQDNQDTTPQDNSDYQDLMDKYNDLEGRFNNLEEKQSYNYLSSDFGDDSFMNFLFSNTDNMPIDFSDYGNPEQPVKDWIPPFSYTGPKIPVTTSNPPTNSSGFRKFSSYEEGRNALERQLNLYKTGRSKTGVKPDSTLLQAMRIYAPASDNNNPDNYADFIARRLGISVNTPIKNIDSKKWADAISIMEGNTGNNPGNLKYQFGGIPVAETKSDLYKGLNDSVHNKMILKLPKQYNLIRGLDSGEPVRVMDEGGHTVVLYGPHDTEEFHGSVIESKLR